MDLLWNGENKVKIQLLCHMPFPHRTNDDGCGGGSSFSQAKERFFNAFHGGLKGGGGGMGNEKKIRWLWWYCWKNFTGLG